MNKITVENLTFAYDKLPILSNIHWTVKEGELWIIVGPNGTGKSTLLQCVSGLLRPKSGQIRIENRPIESYRHRELARRIAYLPQRMVFQSPFSVRELLELSLYPTNKKGIHSIELDDTVSLFQLGSFLDRSLTELSGGELQRVLLASIYIQQADIWLLDEPFSFLDPKQSSAVMEVLDRMLREHQKTIIIVDHHPHHVYFSDYFDTASVMIMESGIVSYKGSLKKASDELQACFDGGLHPVTYKKRTFML